MIFDGYDVRPARMVAKLPTDWVEAHCPHRERKGTNYIRFGQIVPLKRTRVGLVPPDAINLTEAQPTFAWSSGEPIWAVPIAIEDWGLTNKAYGSVVRSSDRGRFKRVYVVVDGACYSGRCYLDEERWLTPQEIDKVRSYTDVAS